MPEHAAQDDIELPLDGALAPPAANGELVFDAPWQGRLLGMAHALAEAGVYAWDDFRAELIAEISAWEAGHPAGADYAYYDCFLAAFERLLAARGLCAAGELAGRVQAFAARPHGHDH